MTMKGSPSNVCKISWLSLASAFVPAALLLLLLPGASQAAVFLQEVTEHPDHTGSCYIEETGESYQLGESWQPNDGKCWQKTCHDFEQGRRQNTFLVSITTCGSVSADAGCVRVEDPTAPFPECCPTYVCPPPSTSQPEQEETTVVIVPDSSENEVEDDTEMKMKLEVASYDVDMGNSYDDDIDFPSPLLDFYRTKYGIRIWFVGDLKTNLNRIITAANNRVCQKLWLWLAQWFNKNWDSFIQNLLHALKSPPPLLL